MEENKFLVPIAIIIAGALIAWGLMSDNGGSKPTNTDVDTKSEIVLAPLSANDHILGNPDADNIIYEYSDLECPFCKNFHFTTKQLMENYGKDGKLAIVFRHFPLDQLHSKARSEAIATECAAELGGNDAFWQYLDLIFTNTPSNNGLDLAQLPNFAEQIGLDKKAFTQCLDNPEMADRVEADYQDGLKAGVLGTPSDPGGTPYSVLVTKDGTKTPIKGAQPYDMVKLLVEAALAQ